MIVFASQCDVRMWIVLSLRCNLKNWYTIFMNWGVPDGLFITLRYLSNAGYLIERICAMAGKQITSNKLLQSANFSSGEVL